MSMKGRIKEDHIPLNNVELSVPGIPSLTPVTLSGIEKVLQAVDLPDRTVASGGQTEPIEFEMALPMHHETEQRGMELWFIQSSDPVLIGYKRAATLKYPTISRSKRKSYALLGLFPKAQVLPDSDMTNEGEQANVTWRMGCDDIVPL